MFINAEAGVMEGLGRSREILRENGTKGKSPFVYQLQGNTLLKLKRSQNHRIISLFPFAPRQIDINSAHEQN